VKVSEILAFCVLTVIVCLVFALAYSFTVYHLTVFENATDNIFTQFQVSNETRTLYNNVVSIPIRSFINLTFILLCLTLAICMLVLLVEMVAEKS
jgi:hypothetical protein